MPDCPKCRSALVRRKNEHGVFWFCEACEGSAATVSLLRKFTDPQALNGLWQKARLEHSVKKHPCPGCNHRMAQVSVTTLGLVRKIDVCTSCQFVWLDDGEWSDLAFFKREKPRAGEEPTGKDPLFEKAAPTPRRTQSERTVQAAEVKTPPAIPKEKRSSSRSDDLSPVVRNSRRFEASRRSRRSSRKGPTEFWHWLPAILGMPVEDEQPLGTRNIDVKPWFTWTLAFGIGFVSLLAMTDLGSIINTYGLVPAEFGRMGGLTWLTSFFLHAGPLHLFGNLYFLVIFGDNVEKCLGALELFLLIVVATLFGSFVHILLDSGSVIPCVGASGGISGVIAFYALRFPKNKLAMMFWFFFKTYWWRMSAIWMFGLWVLLQFVIAGQQVIGISHVSGGAHLGGAFVGVIAWLLWRIGGGTQDVTKNRLRA